MSVKSFIDTNVLVYLLDTDLHKKNIALNLFKNTPTISLNVLNEYSNVCRKKFRRPISNIKSDIEILIQKVNLIIPDLHTVQHALELAEQLGYSHFDSLMLASALESDCTVFYSEDLQDGQLIKGSLRICNPF